MGVLDKYRYRGNRGQVPVKGLFNPGRNQNWDWNELLQTIENNFSTDDSDLAALTARVTSNEADIVTVTARAVTNTADIANTNSELGALTTATNAVAITVGNNTSQVGANKTDIGLLQAQIGAICECLVAAEIVCENCGKDPEGEAR